MSGLLSGEVLAVGRLLVGQRPGMDRTPPSLMAAPLGPDSAHGR